jgi:tetratricopeptide (TPR) repeat protein
MVVAISLHRRTAAAPNRNSFDAAVDAADRARDARLWPDAVEAYRLALEIDPKALHIATQLGHALKEMGDFAGAEEAYGRYLSAHPSDPEIHLQLGHLFNRQGRLDLASGRYQKAIALDSEGTIGHDAARELRQLQAQVGEERRKEACVLMNARRYDEARRIIMVLVSEGAEHLVGILANACKELGCFAEAESWYCRYRTYAATAAVEVQFDAELQSGHFEKIRGNLSAALGHYIRAEKCYGATQSPSCTQGDLRDEIRGCLREISLALAIKVS